MPTLRAQVTVPAVSGVPEDSVQNTWHFITTAGDQPTRAELIRQELENFYGNARGLLSDEFSWSTPTIKVYDLADTPPRVPILEDTMVVAASTTAQASLPREVALCLSFQATPLSGTAQASRRGRLYIGPWGVSANDDGRPSSSAMGDLQFAADAFLDASNTAAEWGWAVWSPTLSSAALVDNGWIDNEWDTQRRRGREATTRLLVPTP